MVYLPRSAWCGVTTTVTIMATLANNMRVDRRQYRLDNDCMMQVSQAGRWMGDPLDDHPAELALELDPSHEPEADPRGEAILGCGGVGTHS